MLTWFVWQYNPADQLPNQPYMFKKIFFYSITAGALSALGSYLYNRIYFSATEEDFSTVLNPGRLIGLNVLACLVAGCGYIAFTTLVKKNGELYFNFAFAILSFASIIIPITIQLPLEIKDPAIFPGLAVPMHFFPALAWFTVRPLFVKEGSEREAGNEKGDI